MQTKKCYKCQEEKDATLFNKNRVRKDGLSTYCKECTKIVRKDFYEGNKESFIRSQTAMTKRSRKKKREFVFNYLRQNPCVDCGESDPIVLEFDHITPSEKFMGVSRLVSKNFSLEKIKKEIDRCEVRCANCHRRRTSCQFNWYDFSGEERC